VIEELKNEPLQFK